MFSYENYVHEAGFARLVLSIVGLLILFIPYRKGERWAIVALGIIIFAYVIPVLFSRYSESRHLAGISKLAYGAALRVSPWSCCLTTRWFFSGRAGLCVATILERAQ